MNASEKNQGSHTILVAHDDTELRRTLIEDLRRGEYTVFEAPDLPTMIEIVLTQDKSIHLVLTDTSTDKRSWAARYRSIDQR
jgi:DNA-binding response OmpR family regulator